MTDLDTSAYTPAQEVENEEQEETVEAERTRFQIPADTAQEDNLRKTLEELKEQVRNNTEFSEHIEQLEELLENYDTRKFIKMFQYECDRCGETFDKKQGIGVHRKMNPNCNDSNTPWRQGKPSYTAKRVDE